MQADFISHVSHQLKTPLSLLSAAMETVTMDRARSPEKLQQYLGIMGGEVARLTALVQRILEYSRLQQQRGFEFEADRPAPLVRETVSAFESSLSARQFAFPHRGTVAAGPRHRRSRGHRTGARQPARQRRQVLGRRARRSTVRLRSIGTSAVIEVVDEGIGIGKDDQRRIFERFYRGAGGRCIATASASACRSCRS